MEATANRETVEPTGGIVAGAALAVALGIRGIDDLRAADIAPGALAVLAAVFSAVAGWQFHRGWGHRRRNLWNAEWYSRQRLDPMGS